MQYLTLTKSRKKLHTLKKLKYSQSLFDQSSFESLKISLSRQLPDPIQSNPCNSSDKSTQFNPTQSNLIHGWIQSVSNSGATAEEVAVIIKGS